MLERITVEDVKRIARLAKAARDVRDQILTPVREQELGQPKPARGVHNPAAALGLDPVPVDHPTRKALGQAIEGLSIDARRELLALIWIGQGDYGAAELDRAFANTASNSGPNLPSLSRTRCVGCCSIVATCAQNCRACWATQA